MEKEILFFTERPPANRTAIHIWMGKTALSHERFLCQLIERYLGVAPKKLAVSLTGKPYLPGTPLHFNLSDCEDTVAVAFSWEAPVGIDIEKVRPIEGMEQLILDCFSPQEQAYVQETNTLVRFWQIWNRKEAYLKALGLGLQSNMSCLDCSGAGWVLHNQVWVRSVPQCALSAAVAIQSC